MYADKSFTAPLNLRGILAGSALALGLVKILAGSMNHSQVYLIFVFFMANFHINVKPSKNFGVVIH